MSRVQIYAGVEQVDVASLTTGGITYRCFVWLAAGGARVEAKIFVDGEDGQLSFVDGAVVATATTDYVDCPRVLAVGTRFVCHWIDTDIDDMTSAVTSALFRSLFDVTAIPTGWASQGSIATYNTNQYDHAVVSGSSPEQFIVSHRTAIDTIVTLRYSTPFTWVNIAWTSTDTPLTIANTVLATHANEADEDVVFISYQDTSLLRTIRRDAGSGGGMATAETFADLLDGDMQFVAVSHVRIAENAYLVVAEAAPDDDQALGGDDDYSRLVAWRQIASGSAAPAHESQWCRNLHLLSRAWTWAAGTTGQLEAFVAVSYKTINDGGEFEQMFGYVVRLDYAALAGANAAGVIRPIPQSAIMDGSIDARPHGSGPNGGGLISIGCRTNHLSHVTGPPTYTLGPDVATVLFAVVRWGRYAVIEDGGSTELQPVEAGAGIVKHTHEPAWTTRRDDKQPTQPDTPAWRGVSRALQLPVATPAGLVLTGGVSTAYDGQQPVEMGFLWTPEIINASPSNGGSIGDALTYYWFVTATWKDARGNVHNGPPSRPVSAALAANQFCTLRIRCINLGMKDDDTRYPLGGKVYLQAWRTYAVGGSLVTKGSETQETAVYLFRAEFGSTSAGGSEIENLPANDPSAFAITVAVGFANTIVAQAELAPYQLNLTTLQWTPPPPIPHQALGAACMWQRRLFGQDPATRSLVWSEEITRQGSRWIWPYFLDTNTFPLDTVGTATALVPLETDLAILTRDGIDTISGDPGAGGSGNTFQIRTIARGIGCIEPRSVCTFTDGFTFQSMKRLHVFTRGSGIEDIGAPIEDFLREAGNVRSAVYLEDRDEIRFTFQEEPGTGPLLIRPRIAIYNLRSRFWVIRNLPMTAQASTASRLNEMMHACAWRGRQGETVHVVLSQGGLLVERSSTSTVYSDEDAASSTTIRLDCTTEWIHLGLDDTKRFHEIGIQTERVNAGALTVEAWYDHDGSWDSDTGAAQQTLTIASPAPEFIRFRPEQGKCRGIKLRIYEPSGVAATENVRLVALVLHYSLKKQRQGSRNNAA